MKNRLKKYKEMVDERLRSFLEHRIERVKDITPDAEDLMDNILEFNMRGGKRIRPVLAIMGYKACGGKGESAILDASIALELMESYLLMHDDIMDQDELRRGYLTMHKIFENKCARCFGKDGKRYGESIALIGGDILAVLGTEALLFSNFPDKHKLRAIDTFNRAVVNTCFGQLLDVKSAYDDNVTQTDIQRLYELKTAVYTFEAPLHIGAQLAGATPRMLKLLSRYSIPLGKAFQLQDDILGLFGTKQKIGKPVGNDIREGKKTALILKTIAASNKRDTQIIRSALGKKNLTQKELQKIKQIVSRSGALEETKKMATDYAFEAKAAVINSEFKPVAQKFLIDLTDYVIHREH